MILKTKQEFIDYWVGNDRLDIVKTEDGCIAFGLERQAVVCLCGKSGCTGWRMEPKILLDTLKKV